LKKETLSDLLTPGLAIEVLGSGKKRWRYRRQVAGTKIVAGALRDRLGCCRGGASYFGRDPIFFACSGTDLPEATTSRRSLSAGGLPARPVGRAIARLTGRLYRDTYRRKWRR